MCPSASPVVLFFPRMICVRHPPTLQFPPLPSFLVLLPCLFRIVPTQEGGETAITGMTVQVCSLWSLSRQTGVLQVPEILTLCKLAEEPTAGEGWT